MDFYHEIPIIFHLCEYFWSKNYEINHEYEDSEFAESFILCVKYDLNEDGKIWIHFTKAKDQDAKNPDEIYFNGGVYVSTWDIINDVCSGREIYIDIGDLTLNELMDTILNNFAKLQNCKNKK